jgi:excisionase family DNA binding protein
MEALTFEQLPSSVVDLKKEFIELKEQIKALLHSKANPELENPLSIDEIVELTGLTKPTLYGYVQRNEIPYHKKKKRLYFFKSELIDWIKTGKQKTLKELEGEAELYMSNKNEGLK